MTPSSTPRHLHRAHPPRAARTRRLGAGLAVLLALGTLPALAPASGAEPGPPPADATDLALVPRPAEVALQEGPGFVVAPTTRVVAAGDAAPVGEYLADLLRPSTGFEVPVDGAGSGDGAVELVVTPEPGLDETESERYALAVTDDGVRLESPTAAGLFRGVQTLRQLLPAQIEAGTVQAETWSLPAVEIADEPRFAYRSSMLDTARRFYPVEDVKRYIDQMALYKLNTLHLHLTDDQGWRIVVDDLPALTEIGGQTQSGWAPGTNTGDPWFYSKADYAEIVDYAASRYIEVVPEIDGPGHTLAAQAAIGSLNCDGQPKAPYYGFDVGNPMVCATPENAANVRVYLEKVIASVAAQNPGRYLHLGGDEVPDPPAGWYEAYTATANEIATAHGKTIVGWHQWAQGSTLPAGSLMQYWGVASRNRPTIGTANESVDVREVRTALAAGARLVVSPADRAYTDMKYDASTPYGLQWAAIVNLRRAYDWDPLTELSSTDGSVHLATEEQVAGVEASLWADRAYRGSSSLPTSHDQFIPPAVYTDHMTFPRMPAIAEVAWSPAGRDYDEFVQRLVPHGERWTELGYGWYRAPDVAWEPVEPVEPELVHHWAFDEGTGTGARDAVTGDEAAVDGARWVPAPQGGGLALDGVDDGVRLDADPVEGSWTLAVWVKRTDPRRSSVLVSDATAGVRTAVKLEQYRDTGRVGLTRLGVADDVSGYATPLDEWVHLALTADGATTRVYADGVEVGQVPATATLGIDQLGRLWDAPGWPGATDAAAMEVDDLRVYTGALDAQAVADLYSEVSPEEGPHVEVEAQVRCLAGRAAVAVRALNTDDTTLDVVLATPWGTRTVAAVAPGASAYQTFSTRSVSVPASTATVTARVAGALDGPPTVVDVDLAATACG
ncbi:family 20 glycosylhydrolase [Cellulosimicrobium protaetiae]|uniref:beta-N-acetylhexosaminidase n=1 Tax=Cellulosimicrobium protaetiae TaxID=2587808 RepID=A0A6M5UIR8_9MICO|nr:family 20 glycosylhydrolase [Cellulosimicrobium protaetiae]QJW37442.1 family 20 glycosylhydrolase [Cellulosimicrobium protaetiae]